NAKRLVALATWSAMVATACATTEFPLTKGKDAVAMFEIGGNEKTLDLCDSEFLLAEPLVQEDFAAEEIWEAAIGVVRDLTPGTLWIHGESAAPYLEKVCEVAHEQLRSGRQVVIQAPVVDHDFWTTPAIEELYQNATYNYYEEAGETRLLRLNYCGHQHEVLVVDQTGRRPPGEDEGDLPIGSRAISFSSGPRIKPEVQSALKRLHQNLGHVGAEDLSRHLRLAGAGPEVVGAAKRLQCEVCARNKRGKAARPWSTPTLLEFNQVVAVDAFSAYDSWGKRYEFISVLDCGTSFHVVFPLSGHSTASMEKDFCVAWSHVFGPPGTLALDLESGLQAGFARYSEFYGVKIRSAAGQAHWQQGSVERHNRLWKEIWDRVVDDHSVTENEVHLAVTAVNSAVNELRRKNGFSPSQAVWGKDPEMPGELLGSKDLEQFDHLISRDHQRAREHALRTAAKETFFRCQTDDKLRRALLQRSRVSGPDLAVGDFVFFYRKAKNQKFWQWHGPATVIGHAGANVWVSRGGRCHLVAPEHLRRATSEELGDAFTSRTTRDDLEKLLELDPDEIVYDDEVEGHESGPELPPGDQEGDPRDLAAAQGRVRDGDHLGAGPSVRKRYRVKGPQDGPGHQLPLRPEDDDDGVDEAEQHDVPPREAPDEAMMLRRAVTARGKEKQLEKELPWSMIPVEQREAFKQAELKQYCEHLDHDALEPLSIEESLRIKAEKKDRILTSRYAYRDKALAKRRKDPTVPWKHKARLVIGGHNDPDIGQGLNTTAPTVSRQSIMFLLQILTSRLHLGWEAHAGDITAAFLNGGPLQRELYLQQPRTGLGDLHPDQLPRIKKGVFGLVDSPHGWWERFKEEATGLRPETEDGKRFVVEQSPLDPCVFFVRDDSVKVSQESYVESRLFQVEVKSNQPDHEMATEEQQFDNRSLVGALSWLAGQTRPDLQASVSMCQQLQKAPTVGDVRFSNLVARRAYEHKAKGVTFYPIDFDRATLLCYHDAGWANAPQNADDPYYKLTDDENLAGTFQEGPFVDKPRKTKRSSSCIASQLGCLYVLADSDILHGKEAMMSVIDWKSHACDRVCRSTFAAETMACCTAVEGGDYLEKYLETLLTGSLQRRTRGRIQIRFLSDCRSLYDHLTREGIPRVPSDRRLAIDLAAVRQDLKSLGRLAWVPTTRQLADVLTKPMKGSEWWDFLSSPFGLSFKEETFGAV
ncbi:RE2, partial [Symbiodinium sp. CCMP2456]